MKTNTFLMGGAIAAALLMTLSPAWAQGGPGDGPMPPMPPPGKSGGGPEPFLPSPEQLDPNGDGNVTLDEYCAAWDSVIKDQFTRLDADGDGALSKDELAACQGPGPRRGARVPRGFDDQEGRGRGPMPPATWPGAGPMRPMPPPAWPAPGPGPCGYAPAAGPPGGFQQGDLPAQSFGRQRHWGIPNQRGEAPPEGEGQRPGPRGGLGERREAFPVPFPGEDGRYGPCAGVSPMPPAQLGGPQYPDSDALFKCVDANKDALISPEELRDFLGRQLPQCPAVPEGVQREPGTVNPMAPDRPGAPPGPPESTPGGGLAPSGPSAGPGTQEGPVPPPA